MRRMFRAGLLAAAAAAFDICTRAAVAAAVLGRVAVLTRWSL